MKSTVFVYAGPTLFGTDIDTGLDSDMVWLPPARRDDVANLITREQPATIALVDGTFHAYPSVSHHELLDALEAGWKVFGLCSMGAIRAAEMAHLGLHPWGAVAQRYLDDPDFNDDEVTLVHDTEAPYLPLSEPLIHMRAFLCDMQNKGHLSAAQADQVLRQMQPRWYAERTLAALRMVLKQVLGAKAEPAVWQALDDFHAYRVKQRDLVAFVQARPWLMG